MSSKFRVDPTQLASAKQFGTVVRFLVYLITGCVLIGAIVDGKIGDWFGFLGISLLSVIPFGRVAWLTYRWKNQNDTRFAVAGAGLILLAVFGITLSVLSR